jgi:DNA-binding NarL/FixJ family response regulator
MPVHRVVVADDDDLMRSALADALDGDPRFEVVASAADGRDLTALVARTGADVVLLDVRMEDGGPAAARRLTSVPAHPPVVVAVSAEANAAQVLEMLRAGATGYLAKGRLGGSLPDLVARCAGGEVLLAVPTAGVALRRLLGTSVDA